MEYRSVIKMNELLSCKKTCRKCNSMLLSEEANLDSDLLGESAYEILKKANYRDSKKISVCQGLGGGD